MKLTINILLLTAITFSGCGNSSEKEKDTDTTKYYFGEVVTTSPDGTIPFGPAKTSLVKRIISEKSKTITESVKQDGQLFDTELKQVNESNKFSVSDKSDSFDGFITFSGENWKWNNWTYDINMKNKSGKRTGSGGIDSEGIKTEKYFSDSAGVKTVRIVEKLNEISSEEYNKLNQK